VSEVASVGGFVQEYQVDVDPDRMRAYGVTLNEVIGAVKDANREVGARTIEVNRVEYLIRGIGFIRKLEDLRDAVIRVNEGVPVFLKQVANVTMGPAIRRGALDKAGAEAVGGAVVVRYGANPMEAIRNVQGKIRELSPGLPRKTLPDGRVSQVRIVPFYDRTALIQETLGTLRSALTDEILVTIVVVLVMVLHLKSSLLIASILPLAVLLCFIFMKVFGVAANVVALSGIAIAIGTLVDMGIIITENVLQHLKEAGWERDRREVIFRACSEVGGAVITAVSITIVSFLPVLTMEGAEGKLFRPLAYTKTFALFASLILAVTVVPALARTFLGGGPGSARRNWMVHEGLIYAGVVLAVTLDPWVGMGLALVGGYQLLQPRLKEPWKQRLYWMGLALGVTGAVWLLSTHWVPLGVEKGWVRNGLFVAVLIGAPLLFFRGFQRFYEPILRWCLGHKGTFLCLPLGLLLLGGLVWLGFDAFFGWLPRGVRETALVRHVQGLLPGLKEEFLPPFDEGSFLFMPSTMPHASIGEALDILQKQDRAIRAIPEVESVVGKLGRAESALDPAPVSMIETVINYKPRNLTGPDGKPLRFQWESGSVDLVRDEQGMPLLAPDGRPYLVRGRFARDAENRLIPDTRGSRFRCGARLWNPGGTRGGRPGRGSDDRRTSGRPSSDPPRCPGLRCPPVCSPYRPAW
jgi:Cu(I)/Ag(I) efflux system membrane protein CusA/SilA